MLRLLKHITISSFMRCVKSRTQASVSLGFILGVMALAVFGMGDQALQIPAVRVALVWLAALLALLLNAALALAKDEEEGALVQLQMLPIATEWLLLGKLLGVWLAVMLPVLVALAPAALLLQLSTDELLRCLTLLLPACWSFWLMSACGSVLLLGNARAQGLHALLVLPLSVPLMIFGCAASAQTGDAATDAVLMLCGIALAATMMCPWLCAQLLALHRAD